MIRKLKNIYHLFQSVAANILHGSPGGKLKIIGVTGTDGKTTTSSLIYHIITSCGKKASMITSVYAVIAGKEYDTGFHVTTPDPFPLRTFLKKSVAAGDEYFILETTSHRLDQNSVYGVPFEIGVITNITHEHLDYHKTYENYVKAKTKLLNAARTAVINKDDNSFSYLKKAVTSKVVTYGLDKNAEYAIDISKKINEHLSEFNKYNYLAAYTVCHMIGLPDEDIFRAMKSFKLPEGRIEVVFNKQFTVIIDFAHTPNSIEQILKYIKTSLIKDKGHIIHIFGSAAKRDESKRPLMGEASGRYADNVILTEEDYRNEDPVKIAREIAKGLEKESFTEADLTGEKTYIINTDRQKAIEKAISKAKNNDVIVITGKGHEKSLCRGNNEEPWDEKKAVIDALKKYDYLQ